MDPDQSEQNVDLFIVFLIDLMRRFSVFLLCLFVVISDLVFVF